MRVMRNRHEAHHRGYRIEGQQKGEGWILNVVPSRGGLPSLPSWRFRTMRGSWTKAVCDVTRYIDHHTLKQAAGRQDEATAANELKAEEIVRLRARLLVELDRLRAKLDSPSNVPTEPQVPHTDSARRRKDRASQIKDH